LNGRAQMKIRVIPTVLTDGLTVVKGEKFDNWRTVGSTVATARLFARRNVDELMFLDVTARSRGTTIDLDLIDEFSTCLDIPFTVGGGINTLKEATECFRRGAEKIVLGTSAIVNSNLITEIADVFGTQAVVVSLDLTDDSRMKLSTNSATKSVEMSARSFARKCEILGAGELLLQSVTRDGLMKGFDLTAIKEITSEVSLPVVASSGAGSPEDFLKAIESGASAVAAGALFQFTENTPNSIRKALALEGIKVRELGEI
jgi:cyclase